MNELPVLTGNWLVVAIVIVAVAYLLRNWIHASRRLLGKGASGCGGCGSGCSSHADAGAGQSDARPAEFIQFERAEESSTEPPADRKR